MNQASYNANKWRRRKEAEGLCTYCGREEPKDDCKLCAECSKRRNEKARMKYEERKKRSMCGSCGKYKVADGVSPISGDKYSYCDKCLDKAMVRQREREGKIKANLGPTRHELRKGN